jgi:hypothetical protein
MCECSYCGEELIYDDVYGRNLQLDRWNRIKEGFIKEGDIYRCDNEKCEYQGFFYTCSQDNKLHEGYPC